MSFIAMAIEGHHEAVKRHPFDDMWLFDYFQHIGAGGVLPSIRAE
jgi:hypothetical protein